MTDETMLFTLRDIGSSEDWPFMFEVADTLELALAQLASVREIVELP